MINPREITRILHEEIKLFVEQTTVLHAPEVTPANLTPEEKLARELANHPLPPDGGIADVIEEVFWASMLTEEGRPCRPRLLYVSRQESIFMRQAVHRLATPVPITRASLRKLTPAQGRLGYLTWDCVSGIPEITGVQGREGGDPPRFMITAPMTGALNINWMLTRLVTLRAGRIERRSLNLKPEMIRALLHVSTLIGGGSQPVYLNRAILTIANEGHGGAVWIMQKGVIPDSNVHIGYKVASGQPLEVKTAGDYEFFVRSIGHLAAVDGAVVVDQDIRVLGFGAFIKIPETPKLVNTISEDNKEEQIFSSHLGGGRHRSAVEFCAHFAPAAAIVVSEDGRISIFWSVNNETLFHAPATIVGVPNAGYYSEQIFI